MKAAILKRYHKQSPKVVIQDVGLPKIGPHQVLLKTLAAGVNPLDLLIARGQFKLVIPYLLPLIMGNEVVGEVIRVGNQVAKFKAGERVFARMPLNKIGAFAEKVAIDESALAKVPEYLTNEEAATVPLTALTAMQAFQLMDVKKNGHLFISGGTGSFGSMAIPLAKAKGLYVITSGSERNKDRVKDLGVDQFIDYRTTDYSQVLLNIDYAIDTLGGSETRKQLSILKDGGKLVSLRGMPNHDFAVRTGMPGWKRLLFGIAGWQLDRLATKNNQHYYFMNVHEDGEQLATVSEVLEKTRLRPKVDRCYPFAEVNDALAHVAAGHLQGKTVLTFED